MTPSPRITWHSWAMILALAFIWGSTFMVTEVALTGITPFWLAAARVIIAASLMGVIWGARGFRLFATPAAPRTMLSVIAIAALSTAVPFSLLAWGQQHVTSGFAGVSMASTALIILPLAHLFVPGEQMTLRRLCGFAIGFAGVVVLIGGQAFDTSGSAMEFSGRMACVGAACCYACSSIVMRRLPQVDAIGLATVLLLIASVMTGVNAVIQEGAPPLPSGQIIAVLLFLGLLPTAAANLMRVMVIRTAGPVFMSLVNYQVPLWSVLMGALVLSEPLPPTLLYAMVLILAGVAISQWGALRRLFTRRA